MSDFECLDEDEQREYQNSYLATMDRLAADLEKEDRDSLFQEMETIRYNPSDNAAQDAELNYLRSQKILADKKRKLGGPISSFLKFKARADGQSGPAVEKWARKAMKEEN